MKDGFALIGAKGYTEDGTDEQLPAVSHEGKTFLYARTSNFAKWSLVQTFVSSFKNGHARVLNETSRLAEGNDIDATAPDLFGGSVVLFDGPVNTQSTVAIGAELGFGTAIRSGVVYLQNVAKLGYVYKQKDDLSGPGESGPGNGLSGDNEEPTTKGFFSFHSMGIFVGLICGVVVPSTVAAAVLIYRFRSQSVVNSYEKANAQQPVLEEFELSDIIDPEQQLAARSKS